ncbi:MAG: phosphatase PAP2 family protein [Novosphingobium sp.]
MKQTLRIDAKILVSFLVLAVLALVFWRIASAVTAGDTLAFDRHVMAALRQPGDAAMPVGPRWLRSAMLDITALGGVAVLTVLTVVVTGYLLMTRKAAMAALVAVAVSGGALVSTLLKGTFNRPRPDIVPHLVEVHTTSFPSGHAMNSAVVFLTLGALLARTHQTYSVRAYVIGVSILLTLAIGFSRVYLGVHWPSDVLAGWVVGGSWALLWSLIARRLQHRHHVESASQP